MSMLRAGGGHDDLQRSFQPQEVCGIGPQKVLSTEMCVNCHHTGVLKAPESEQPSSTSDPEPSCEGQCLWLIFSQAQTDMGGNALPFAQPSRGQSSQLCVGSSPRTVYVFYNKQSWDKTKQNQTQAKSFWELGWEARNPTCQLGALGSALQTPFPSFPGAALLLCLYQRGKGCKRRKKLPPSLALLLPRVFSSLVPGELSESPIWAEQRPSTFSAKPLTSRPCNGISRNNWTSKRLCNIYVNFPVFFFLFLFPCFALQHISEWKQTAWRSVILLLLFLHCYLRAEGLAFQPHIAYHTSAYWFSNSLLWFMGATDIRSGSCAKKIHDKR